MALPDDVRAACAEVARRPRHVAIDDERVVTYATTLGDTPPAPDAGSDDDERRAAFSLQLNAINFGSGWFPTLRKRAGMSGFRTVEAGVRGDGPGAAQEVAGFTAGRTAAAPGQDPSHPLMGQFAVALRELGAHVAERHGGRFAALARAHASCVGVAEELATLPTWHDVSPYGDLLVPLWKRAQIAAA